jgi:hypothetical protein
MTMGFMGDPPFTNNPDENRPVPTFSSWVIPRTSINLAYYYLFISFLSTKNDGAPLTRRNPVRMAFITNHAKMRV